MKKEDEYAMKIVAQVANMLDMQEEGENFIDMEEFNDDDNMLAFTYAISILAPTLIVKKMTGKDFDVLSFNHMANRLIYQFMRKEYK